MSFFDKVYKIVKMIPYGRVGTYGQIAALAGSPRAARQVGWALHQTGPVRNPQISNGVESKVMNIPWWRVVNREGRISTTCLEHPAQEQAHLLKKEQIPVKYKDGNYWIDLESFQWKPQN